MFCSLQESAGRRRGRALLGQQRPRVNTAEHVVSTGARAPAGKGDDLPCGRTDG